MFSLVLHALRARRAQALAMFALAVLAGLGAAAAPWFLAWGNDAVARSTVAAAPATDRLVTGTGTVQVDLGGGSPVDALGAAVAEHLPIAGAETNLGARILISMSPVDAGVQDPGADEPDPDEPGTRESIDMDLATRTNLCAHLQIVDGACGLGEGEVLLSRAVAQRLGVGVGDRVHFTGIRLPVPQTLTVAGVYDLADPFGLYWSGTDLRAQDDDGRPAAFVGEQAFLNMQPSSMEMSLHVELPAAALVQTGDGLRDVLNGATVQLARAGFSVSTPTRGLLERIARDRLLVASGVAVGAGQLVLVSWVGLFLAVRHTSDERRGDVGLLKLRGTTTRRLWLMIGLSSGLPMLAGTLVGAAGGFVAAAALAYRLDPDAGPLAVARTVATDPRNSLWLSLAAAAIAGLGGLVAAVVAEWRTTRAPVVDLLRRVPGGRRGWRADVADLVVVAVAAAGVYQGWVDSREDRASALALLTPLLVGLAVGLLAARTLPLAANWAGRSALRSGRAGAALAALQLARRQGTQRVFAVLVVAAAVFTTMTILWQGASAAWHQRAVQELGADRVLAVDAPSAAALMQAVRSVDPEGRYAMAVASTLGVNSDERVVALDTTRYAAVGRLPAGLPAPAQLTPMLRPDATEPPQVVDGLLALDVTAPDTGPSIGLGLHVSTLDGQRRRVDYPALTPGRHVAEVTVDGCGSPCRLVGIEVLLAPGTAPSAPVTVVIHELRQPGGIVLDGQLLGDITRWRTTLEEPAWPPMLSVGDSQLAVTLLGARPGGALPDERVIPLAAPVPLPVVVAGGQLGGRGSAPRITVLGGTEVPATVAAEVRALPVVGNRGVLVDLEYALRNNDAAVEAADLSVWLTNDAPDSLVAALAEHGVTVLGERSVASRARDLAEFGPGLALQFGYFAVTVILLLAAMVALVGSTVDRSGRVAELVALRGQGLSTRAVRVAGLAGTAVMVGAAALIGVVAAMISEGLVATALPAFADNWRLLPTPPGLTPASLLISIGVIVVALGVAGVVGAGRLVAAATGHRADRGARPARHSHRKGRAGADAGGGRS